MLTPQLARSVIALLVLVVCTWCVSACSLSEYGSQEMPCHQEDGAVPHGCGTTVVSPSSVELAGMHFVPLAEAVSSWVPTVFVAARPLAGSWAVPVSWDKPPTVLRV